jgi:hypothetical protein
LYPILAPQYSSTALHLVFSIVLRRETIGFFVPKRTDGVTCPLALHVKRVLVPAWRVARPLHETVMPPPLYSTEPLTVPWATCGRPGGR